MRIDVLIATDVLSEGVDLHDANVVVHLDLPWTVARLDQRVGRLRRMGSPHDQVQRYAFQPPAAGNAALHLLDRLAAKAGLSDGLVGLTPGSFDHPGQTETRVASPADARDALRELTRDWRRPEELRKRRASPCAAVRCSMGESGILAAVTLNDEHLLVGVLNEEVVVDPSWLLQLARGVTKTAVPLRDHLARRGREALEAWFEAEQARGALLLEAIQRSDSHRRLLRVLQRCLGQGGRYLRHELLPVATELRALVLGSQGIAAETTMNSWMTAHPRPTTSDMRALVEALRPRVRARNGCRSPGRIVAMLLLVPD
jgi:hypothetical protein